MGIQASSSPWHEVTKDSNTVVFVDAPANWEHRDNRQRFHQIKRQRAPVVDGVVRSDLQAGAVF